MVVHITVLGTWGECEAIRGKACWVNRTEVTMHLNKFIPKNNIVNFHFKTTLRGICGCHILCILSTCHDHVELLILVTVKKRADCCWTTWLSIVEFTDCFKCLWVNQLCVAVFWASHQHGIVVSQLEREDFSSVHAYFICKLIVNQVIKQYLSVVCCNNNWLVFWSPNCFGK